MELVQYLIAIFHEKSKVLQAQTEVVRGGVSCKPQRMFRFPRLQLKTKQQKRNEYLGLGAHTDKTSRSGSNMSGNITHI